jgi:hypothetical protein
MLACDADAERCLGHTIFSQSGDLEQRHERLAPQR